MKNLLVLTAAGLITFSANAQSADQAARDAACKDLQSNVDKNIKNTENPKKGLKAATWVTLADAYVDLARQCTSDSMAAVKGYDAYKKALTLDEKSGAIKEALSSPKLASALLQQGASYYNNHNLPKAGELFSMSESVNAKDTTAALYSGIVSQTLKQTDKAAESFRKFIANGGKDPAVFFSLAQLYRNDKKYDEAIATLQKGSALNPNNKDLKTEVVNTYLSSNNIDAAIAALSKITETEPNNVSNLSNIGLLYDNKAQAMNTKINDLKSQIEGSNTASIESKLNTANLSVGDFDAEIAKVTKSKAKDLKARVAELNAKKKEKLDLVEKLKKELADKKANSAGVEKLNTELASLKADQKAAKTKAFEAYNKVLALDANNYDVNYNVAVMYFNDAVETKKVLDNMDMKAYQVSGKEYEAKACEQFRKAKPFFDKCSSLNAGDEMVKENLKNLDQILSNCK